jgi:hypothetical protein
LAELWCGIKNYDNYASIATFGNAGHTVQMQPQFCSTSPIPMQLFEGLRGAAVSNSFAQVLYELIMIQFCSQARAAAAAAADWPVQNIWTSWIHSGLRLASSNQKNPGAIFCSTTCAITALWIFAAVYF